MPVSLSSLRKISHKEGICKKISPIFFKTLSPSCSCLPLVRAAPWLSSSLKMLVLGNHALLLNQKWLQVYLRSIVSSWLQTLTCQLETIDLVPSLYENQQHFRYRKSDLKTANHLSMLLAKQQYDEPIASKRIIKNLWFLNSTSEIFLKLM